MIAFRRDGKGNLVRVCLPDYLLDRLEEAEDKCNVRYCSFDDHQQNGRNVVIRINDLSNYPSSFSANHSGPHRWQSLTCTPDFEITKYMVDGEYHIQCKCYRNTGKIAAKEKKQQFRYSTPEFKESDKDEFVNSVKEITDTTKVEVTNAKLQHENTTLQESVLALQNENQDLKDKISKLMIAFNSSREKKMDNDLDRNSTGPKLEQGDAHVVSKEN